MLEKDMQYQKFSFFKIFFSAFIFILFMVQAAYSGLNAKSPLNSESTKALQAAQLLFDPQNRQVSIDALQSYLKKGEQHPYLYFKLAEWLYQANNFSTAEKVVKQALKLDNRFSEAWQLLAFCENSQGESEKPLTQCKNCWRLTRPIMRNILLPFFGWKQKKQPWHSRF